MSTWKTPFALTVIDIKNVFTSTVVDDYLVVPKTLVKSPRISLESHVVIYINMQRIAFITASSPAKTAHTVLYSVPKKLRVQKISPGCNRHLHLLVYHNDRPRLRKKNVRSTINLSELTSSVSFTGFHHHFGLLGAFFGAGVSLFHNYPSLYNRLTALLLKHGNGFFMIADDRFIAFSKT